MKLQTLILSAFVYFLGMHGYAAESAAQIENWPYGNEPDEVEAPEEDQPVLLNTSYSQTQPSQNSAPRYSFPYNNGLYASLAGFLSVKKIQIPNEKTYTLKVPSFSKPFAVKAVIQDRPAPLVVILAGIGGTADSDFTKLWPSWYAAEGFNVLWFDSTFMPKFTEASRQGVSGNLWAETGRVRDLVAEFLQMPQLAGKFSGLAVVGTSYGGIEALMLGQMANENRLPFKIDSIQSYSPPINMGHTSDLLDRWYNQYRWKYTLIEMRARLTEKALSGEYAFDDEFLKAAAATAFHFNLVEVVMANDRIFHLNALPKNSPLDEEQTREDYANTWGFMKYAYDMAFPYWKEKLHLTSMEQLIKSAALINLLAHQPAYSQTILAVDDPLDLPSDMAELRAFAAQRPGAVVFLPHGGHVGYVSNRWTRAKLLSVFNRQVESQPVPASIPDQFR